MYTYKIYDRDTPLKQKAKSFHYHNFYGTNCSNELPTIVSQCGSKIKQVDHKVGAVNIVYKTI